MRLLITDLDNTLYDWVSYFATAFQAMVKQLAVLLSVDEETLRDQFKRVHQQHENSEQPFAIFELPAVHAHFGDLSNADLYQRLREPLNAFRSAREESLRLYPSVSETLRELFELGVVVVGYTEAMAELAYQRLELLGILPFFSHLYALDGKLEPHPDPDRNLRRLASPPDFLTYIHRDKRKPNPALLQAICSKELISPSQACYVGDSLIRDVAMAKAAGLTAVWARYGTNYPADLWQVVVRVTHWTDKDVLRESELRELFHDTRPDYTVDSFGDLIGLFEHADSRSAGDVAAVHPADVA